jgi:hypothetical protein
MLQRRIDGYHATPARAAEGRYDSTALTGIRCSGPGIRSSRSRVKDTALPETRVMAHCVDRTERCCRFAIRGNMASNDDSGLADTEVKLLAPVPMGAAWLAGTAVALLLVAWFLIWLLIYLPRGPIG